MKLLTFLLWLSPVFAIPILRDEEINCGYKACPVLNSSELNIHLVAHSHDDVGWLKTVDQYYYGLEGNIQFAGVQYILDSVIQALSANPKRKFIQAETAFLHKWWQELNDRKKEQVRALINNGQLEIVGGGWSMNDESAAHYHSIIDQLTFGIKILMDTFGECARPKIGWQIDPFGHTREMASLFSQMGFDALFFARLDFRDKTERLLTQTAEMLWRGSANLEQGSMLFTHALYDHYSPPKGFYFDVLSSDDSLIPDTKSPEYNLKEKMAAFNEYVKLQSSNYTSNNIMLTMGNDFTYQDAHYNFKNLDILIKAYEDMEHFDSKNRRIRLHYSTPNCYIKAVNNYATETNLSYTVKTDDFIPYASDKNSYWTGYYTSRPTHKRFERQGNNLLQIVKQLTSTTLPDSVILNERLDELRKAMGMMQHHDAITGTEKKAVSLDYARIVFKAFENSVDIASTALRYFFEKENEDVNLEFKSCFLANISHCQESQAEKFVVAVYNPLSRKVSHHVRLPVDSDSFEITDFNGKALTWQVTPSIDGFTNVPEIHKSKFDLLIYVEDIPPLGAKILYVNNLRFGRSVSDINPDPDSDPYILGNEETGVSLNPLNGFLKTITLNTIPVNVRQELMYYIGALGSNIGSENRSSGAYIFRPDSENPEAIPFTNNIVSTVKAYKGDLVDEVHQVFNNWAKQIIRVYKNEKDYVEFDWLVGPIDTDDGDGKEIISRFTLGTTNPEKNTFYTDSNGRELLKRVNNYRETYEYSNEEAVAGNYYPITSSISVIDLDKRMEISVLTDRSQGGASLKNGEIELMLHRRLLEDDNFGVAEALDEDEFGSGLRVRGQHFFTFGSTSDGDNIPRGSKTRRSVAQKKLLAPWVFVADASDVDNDFLSLSKKLLPEFSLLTRDLPEQVKMLTLEMWDNNQVLIRFEHILEISEGGTEVTIDIEGLFVGFEISALAETTLDANLKLEESSRLQWTQSKCVSGLNNCKTGALGRDGKAIVDGKVTLQPMEIRTFIGTVVSN